MARNAVNRADLVGRATLLLPPGTHIRQVFICQTAPFFWLFVVNYLTCLTIFWIEYCCVAVADEGIYVLESSKSSGGGKPRSLLGVVPRYTKLGPVAGTWGTIELLGRRYRVHKRFHHLIDDADRNMR